MHVAFTVKSLKANLHRVTGAIFVPALGDSVPRALLDFGLKNRRIPPEELLLLPLLRSELGRLELLLDECTEEEVKPREQAA